MARPALLQVLRNGSDRAQEAALAAIGDAHGGARSEIVAWAHRQVDRAAALRRAQNALREERLDERREFLDATLGRRIGRLEDRAVLAAATLSSPDAAGVLRRSLRAPDQDVRAQAIETLDTLVDRRLGRALAALLEAPPAVAAGSAGATRSSRSLSTSTGSRPISRRRLRKVLWRIVNSHAFRFVPAVNCLRALNALT
jgi:hypothetical protein